MHNLHSLSLLLFGFMGLTGLGFTAMLVMNGQKHKEKVKSRFDAITAGHARHRQVSIPRVVRPQNVRRANSPLERIASVFGFNAARPDQYSAKWYWVVILTLVVSRLLTELLLEIVGPAMWIALPLIWIMMSRAIFNMMLLRRRNALYVQFPDCLSMIVRSVRAGVPLSEAVRIVAKESAEPSSTEFARVAGDLAIGTTIADALRALADRAEIAEFRFFATALTLQSQTGGRLGETLDNLAGIVRRRMQLKSRGKALASEARTTAYILGGLPVLAMTGLYLLNPAYVNVLFFDPTGRLILFSAFGSLGVGAFIMRTIIVKSLA